MTGENVHNKKLLNNIHVYLYTHTTHTWSMILTFLRLCLICYIDIFVCVHTLPHTHTHRCTHTVIKMLPLGGFITCNTFLLYIVICFPVKIMNMYYFYLLYKNYKSNKCSE